MVHSRWVVNASPLILLGKINRIQLFEGLVEQVAVPTAVIREISAKPDGERTVQMLMALKSVIILDDVVPAASILSWHLGIGETQVISHAVTSLADRVVIDDLEARRCAKAMGLAVIGTLGLVGRAKNEGLLERVEPIVQKLRESGLYVSDQIVRRLLSEAGE